MGRLLTRLSGGRGAPAVALPAAVGTAPHLSYTAALGRALKSPLAAGAVDEPDLLLAHRLGSCPVQRATTWYISGNGDDDTGDGSPSAPWRSLDRANEVGRPHYAINNQVGATYTGANAANYFAAGNSVTIAGWARVDNSGSGSLVSISDSVQLLIGAFRAGIGHDGKPALRVTDAGNTVTELIFSNAVFPAFTGCPWAWVAITYNGATGAATLRIDDAVESGTLGIAKSPASAAVSVFGGAFGWGGCLARLGIYNRVLTNAELTTLKNGTRGLRWYECKRFHPAIWNSALSWWECDDETNIIQAFETPVTLADKKGIGSLGGQGRGEPSFDVDPAITANGSNTGPAGGADTTISFARGGRYGGVLGTSRAGLGLNAYGGGAKPVLTNFTQAYAAGGWTPDTGTTYYRASPNVVWVKRQGEDTFETFSTPLTLMDTVANVRATPNSFCWSSGSGGRVYINLGAAGDPGAWEGVPAVADGYAASHTMQGDNVAVDGLNFLGGGLSVPGNPSGYGLQLSLPAGPPDQAEQVVTNSDFAYTGYHALGFIQGQYSVGTSALNRAGVCSARNPGSLVGDQGPASTTAYVWYVGDPGDNEILSWNDTAYGGVLESYCGEAPNRVGGQASYNHDGPWRVSLVKNLRVHGTAALGKTVLGPVAGSAATAVEDSTGWVIAPTATGTAQGLDLSGLYIGSCLINYAASGIPYSGSTGYLRSVGGYGDGARWFVNCDIEYDITAGGSTTYLYGNYPPSNGQSEQWINSRIRFSNVGSKGVALTDTAMPSGNLGQKFRNTVLSSDGAGTVALGSGVTASNLVNCGFYHVSSAGTTNPVTLSAHSPYDSSAAGTPLAGAGTATGAPVYDRALAARPTPPAIGPRE